MSYVPEVGTDRITDGAVAFVDLDPALQAMLGALPVGVGVDFEGFTLPAGWLWEDGAAVSRATYSDLFDAITLVQNGTLNATINVTGLTSTKGIRVGCPVEGANIPASTTVATIVSATAITLSAAATGSGVTSLRFLPHGAGDGSTTFNTPDARGRVGVGMDDLGGNGDAGNLDAAQVGIGRQLGAQTVALVAAEAPLRSHTHSGTTASDNTDHSHSGTTGTVSSDHGHSGTTGDINQNHQHSMQFSYPTGPIASGSVAGSTRYVGQGFTGVANTGFVTSGHTHNFSTGGISANHTHAITTGGRSAFHQHTFTTGTPSVAEANGTAHQNMQPSRLVNRIVYAGA